LQVIYVVRYHSAMEPLKRPPNDRGQGRKPLAAHDKTVTVSIRVTASLRDKLAELGGAAWIREQIAKARV
jgi:hypothetical protein